MTSYDELKRLAKEETENAYGRRSFLDNLNNRIYSTYLSISDYRKSIMIDEYTITVVLDKSFYDGAKKAKPNFFKDYDHIFGVFRKFFREDVEGVLITIESRNLLDFYPAYFKYVPETRRYKAVIRSNMEYLDDLPTEVRHLIIDKLPNVYSEMTMAKYLLSEDSFRLYNFVLSEVKDTYDVDRSNSLHNAKLDIFAELKAITDELDVLANEVKQAMKFVIQYEDLVENRFFKYLKTI